MTMKRRISAAGGQQRTHSLTQPVAQQTNTVCTHSACILSRQEQRRGKVPFRRTRRVKTTDEQANRGRLIWRSFSVHFYLFIPRLVFVQVLLLPGKVSTMSGTKDLDAEFLNGQYYVHSELGCGGFGKVKLATHSLTGDNVAIKIIDKKAVGADLFRVKTELDVLKTMSHQHICRMYQYFETDTKCYIVMEYCNGGEMFDYIVRKDRLDEGEARFFFRQLLEAMAYAHSVGICHRDLKPENLMLTASLTLKVIDFGLSSRPSKGLAAPLQTCCGSPAYAAPEIIEHNTYYGHEVDIWSMGVLLYVLLCGVLPFEDESLPKLYKKIRSGVYYEPDYLSPLSKDILRAMLQVNPRHRISMKDLLEHKWILKAGPVKWKSNYDKDTIDNEVALEMAFYHGISTSRMTQSLKQWKYDYSTATYLILEKKKENKQSFALPMYRATNQNFGEQLNVTNSPTLHKSLENDLDRIDLGDNNAFEAISDTSTGAVACGSPSQFVRGPRTSRPSRDVTHTPILSARHKARQTGGRDCNFTENKENYASLRARGPVRTDNERIFDAGFMTPRRPGVPIMGSNFKRAHSAERTQPKRSETTNSTPEPTPSETSDAKIEGTPTSRRSRESRKAHLPRRVFTSLERSGAKLKNLLTPKKLNTNRDLPASINLKSDARVANISVTSSDDCVKVREALIRVLLEQNVSVTADKWTISGKKSCPGKSDTVIELEVVWLETLNLVGVRRRRLTGDALTYKKVCEQVLALAGL
uniref:non-specific serine/threonine protein kinase n=1 Tax=Panagrellus redivivus TaxID=6233 RepID=A0A7E4VY02_PANRE